MNTPDQLNEDDLEQDGGVAARAEQPGERQAIWIITRMEEVQEDPEMRVDAKELLTSMSNNAQKYLAWLLREGPQSHQAASAHFGAKPATIDKAAAEVVDTLKRVVAD